MTLPIPKVGLAFYRRRKSIPVEYTVFVVLVVDNCQPKIMLCNLGQLEKALPKEIISKYEERAQEESLNLAGMEGLVR